MEQRRISVVATGILAEPKTAARAYGHYDRNRSDASATSTTGRTLQASSSVRTAITDSAAMMRCWYRLTWWWREWCGENKAEMMSSVQRGRVWILLY